MYLVDPRISSDPHERVAIRWRVVCVVGRLFLYHGKFEEFRGNSHLFGNIKFVEFILEICRKRRKKKNHQTNLTVWRQNPLLALETEQLNRYGRLATPTGVWRRARRLEKRTAQRPLNLHRSSASSEHSEYIMHDPTKDVGDSVSLTQEAASMGMAADDDNSLDSYLKQNQSSQSQSQPSMDTKPVPAFAAKYAVASDIGQPLDEELADSVNYLMSHHLEEKTLEDTSSKYPCPSNCQFLDTPKVNQTIWENLSAPVRTKDVKLQKVQESLTRGIAAYVTLLDPNHISSEQQDVLALLCNANFEMNALRKELIKPDLNSRFTHLCKSTNPVTKYLFGDDLGKQVKDLQDQHKAAAGVMKGAHKRPRTAYQPYPYQSQGSDASRRYRDAGWSTKSPRATQGNASKPFLGQRNLWKQRASAQAPHTYTPMASRGSHYAPQARRAGQGEK